MIFQVKGLVFYSIHRYAVTQFQSLHSNMAKAKSVYRCEQCGADPSKMVGAVF